MNKLGPKPASGSPPRQFIFEFEGLRGLLAAWVVFGHILLFSGYTYKDGWFGIVFSPVLGVYAFMMLSGFVISAALDQRPTTWFQFMSRRFFRLFPVYVLCLLLAIVTFNVSVHISQSETLSVFGPKNLERLANVDEKFETYLVADATLLQCLLPRSVYTYAHESFLPPTWSLTIEWLFYSIAPFILWGLHRNRLAGCASVTLAVGLVYLFENQLIAINQSFHLGNALHFVTGIGSYFVWKHLPERHNCLFTKIAFWAVAVCCFALLGLPYKIWFATLTLILYSRVHSARPRILEWPRRLLISKPLLFLGRTSYVTYLLHWIVIELVLFWLIQFAPEINNRLLLATICTLVVFPVTYLVAHVIHRHLEVPMIALPKRLGQRKKHNSVAIT